MDTYRFHVDGAPGLFTYEVEDHGTPVDHHGIPAAVVITGLRTRVRYVSPANDLAITGTTRRHTGLGMGRRAVLTLDTGEGLSVLRGVVQGPVGR